MKSELFNVENLDTDALKDIFKNYLEGFSKTVPIKGRKYPRSVTYTISHGELIITELEVEPYKPSVVSRIGDSTEIWTFFNKYGRELEDYYETFRK